MEANNQSPPQATSQGSTKEELTNFYRQDLPKLLKTFFAEPISGTYSIFSNRSGKTYLHSLILILSTGVVYILLPYLLLGKARAFIPFSSVLMLGMVPMVFMLLITAFSFGLKSFSGKADLKNELLTGGLCGIPLAALMLLAFIGQLFTTNTLYEIIAYPRNIIDLGLFFVLALFYLALMLINIVQQSLKSSGTGDALSWYAAPALVLAAFYLTVRISIALS